MALLGPILTLKILDLYLSPNVILIWSLIDKCFLLSCHLWF